MFKFDGNKLWLEGNYADFLMEDSSSGKPKKRVF